MSSASSVRPVGDRAVLLELEGHDAVHATAAMVRSIGGDRVEDVVAGHRTVLVVWRSPPVDVAVVSTLRKFCVPDVAPPVSRSVAIPVRYDGPDLADVAELVGMSVEEVIGRHAAARYRVAFMGFAPGFAYLVDGDARLHVPRRVSPRPRVPPGAVALAGEYSAVYPSSSPGGWQLIGTTETRMFDLSRDPAALLEPGVEVRFEPAP